MLARTLYLLIAALYIVACSPQEPETEERSSASSTAMTSDTSSTRQTDGGAIMGLTISSSAFNDGGMIPQKYTCDGENISPPLSWSGLPDNTQSIALIADDPDAPRGTWVHWVAYNLPPNVNGMEENMPKDETLHNHAHQGINSSNKVGYSGPCPPGGTHRYFFKLYALDAMLPLEGEVTKERLIEAMTNHIVGEAELMGKYERNR